MEHRPRLMEREKWRSSASLTLKTPACASQVCIVNHFQGRVTCPYGQSVRGQGPDGTPGCKVPGTCDPIAVEVPPQCADRSAAETVYCSCRCANAEGRTDDVPRIAPVRER